MKIIDELPSTTSAFWDKVLNHAALLGMLLGFGAENSWAFHWKYCTQTNCLNAMGKDFSDTPQYLSVSTNNFPLPIFAIFTDEKILKKYKTEQQNIRKIYKHNDFLDLTLKRLMM